MNICAKLNICASKSASSQSPKTLCDSYRQKYAYEKHKKDVFFTQKK